MQDEENRIDFDGSSDFFFYCLHTFKVLFTSTFTISPIFWWIWSSNRLESMHNLVKDWEFSKDVADKKVVQPDAKDLKHPSWYKNYEKCLLIQTRVKTERRRNWIVWIWIKWCAFSVHINQVKVYFRLKIAILVTLYKFCIKVKPIHTLKVFLLNLSLESKQ